MGRKHLQTDQGYQSHWLLSDLDTYIWRRARKRGAPRRGHSTAKYNTNFIHECFRSDEKSILKIYETQNPHDVLNHIFEKYVFLVYKN